MINEKNCILQIFVFLLKNWNFVQGNSEHAQNALLIILIF